MISHLEWPLFVLIHGVLDSTQDLENIFHILSSKIMLQFYFFNATHPPASLQSVPFSSLLFILAL